MANKCPIGTHTGTIEDAWVEFEESGDMRLHFLVRVGPYEPVECKHRTVPDRLNDTIEVCNVLGIEWPDGVTDIATTTAQAEATIRVTHRPKSTGVGVWVNGYIATRGNNRAEADKVASAVARLKAKSDLPF